MLKVENCGRMIKKFATTIPKIYGYRVQKDDYERDTLSL